MDLTEFQRLNLTLYRQLRDAQPTWAWLLRKHCRRFLLFGGIGIGGASLVTLLGFPAAGVGLLGLVAGALLRDIGMMRRFLLLWPALALVLNWEVLDELVGQRTMAVINAELADGPERRSPGD